MMKRIFTSVLAAFALVIVGFAPTPENSTAEASYYVSSYPYSSYYRPHYPAFEYKYRYANRTFPHYNYSQYNYSTGYGHYGHSKRFRKSYRKVNDSYFKYRKRASYFHFKYGVPYHAY